MSKFVVIVVRDVGKNRLVTVVDSKTREPLYYPSLYSVAYLRPPSRPHSTVGQALQGVAKLHTFLAIEGIDLQERVSSRDFMCEEEIVSLVAFLHRGEGQEAPTGRAWGGRRARPSGNQTVAVRLKSIVNYLEWFLKLSSRRCWPLKERDAALEQAQEFLLTITRRRPPWEGADADRTGLTPAQFSVLVALLHRLADAVDGADEPAAFRMVRTLLLFEHLIEFGLRIGELLGIRLADIDTEGGTVWIVRRPDAEDDTRADDARVKGLSRMLPMSPYLARRTREHVDRFRASRPNACGHDFLFIWIRGDPLSRSTVNRMFENLREEEPALGLDFSCHVMRHTWNDVFSDDAIAEGMTEADQSDVRSYFMGWADPRSERPYLRGRRRRQARAIVLRSQERLRSLLRRAGRG